LTGARSPLDIAIEKLPGKDGEVWHLSGEWVNTTAVAASKRLADIGRGQGGALEIDLGGVTAMIRPGPGCCAGPSPSGRAVAAR
jgi:phospholipid/cholesterol/gamma-HCH transport system permease protein